MRGHLPAKAGILLNLKNLLIKTLLSFDSSGGIVRRINLGSTKYILEGAGMKCLTFH